MNEFKEYEQEFLEAPGASLSERLKFMELKRLDRIAGVLEDINCTLISMGGDIEALSECVDMNSFGIHFLRVDTGA